MVRDQFLVMVGSAWVMCCLHCILVRVGCSVQGPVLNSNPVSIGSKSYTDLLKSSLDFIQPIPMMAAPLKKGGYVSF